MYSVGGFIGQSFSAARDVYRYDPTENEWATVAPLPAPRGALAVAELNGLLYAVGGNGQSGASVTDHAVYDPVGEHVDRARAAAEPRATISPR